MASIQKRDVFIYINNYIKEKYPIYFNEFGNIKNEKPVYLISWVNELFNKLCTSYSFDDIVNGMANKELKKLIDEDIEKNMSGVKKKFDAIKNHIIKVIHQNSRFKCSQILVEKIATQIALEMNDKISSDKLLKGNYDSEIFDNYLILGTEYKSKLFSYVKQTILSPGKNTGFSEDSLDKIFNDMALVLLEEYGRKNILTSEWINTCFQKISQSIKKKVQERITLVVNNIFDNADVMIRVSKRQVISDILILATVRGEISATKIVNGELDGFIRSYIKGKQIVNEEQKRADFAMGLAIEHVFKVLVDEADEDIIHSELEKFASVVYQELKSQNFKDSDIIEYKCDQYIRNRYMQKYHLTQFDVNRERMREKSVSKKPKNKKNTNSIFSMKLAIKRKIQQEMAKILIVSVLGSVGGYVAGNYINRREDMKSAAIVQEMDDTNYSIDKYSNMSIKRSYERGVNGVVQSYNDYNTYGNEYGYLCFYNAYQELGVNELDHLLRDVRSFCVTNEENNGLIDLVQDVDCFYDYMYDCLVKLGCEEIRNARYLDAILSYKQSYYGNRYGIPSDFLVHAGDQRALDDMCKLYEEYNYKYQVQLGNIIQQNQESTGIKRGV